MTPSEIRTPEQWAAFEREAWNRAHLAGLPEAAMRDEPIDRYVMLFVQRIGKLVPGPAVEERSEWR